MTFTPEQITQLLKPIAKQRVLQDGKSHSHVSQQDVTAHLIRMFGFGGFDTEVLSIDCVFAEPTKSISKGKQTPDPNRYDVCYRALMRLTVKDVHGAPVAQYEDGSTATAQNQTLGDGHDLAYKSAISLAKKRCAINLGDQFGLSLYNKGQTSALVIKTLVGADAPAGDVQEGVPQQVTLGNDETDYEPAPVMGPAPEPVDLTPWLAQIAAASTSTQLAKVGTELAAATLSDQDRKKLRAEYTTRVHELNGAVKA
jgi:hypothetical protein